MKHICVDVKVSEKHSWWEKDAQNIPLARVCEVCIDAKLSGFRQEILTGYTQSDVDEPIEAE